MGDESRVMLKKKYRTFSIILSFPCPLHVCLSSDFNIFFHSPNSTGLFSFSVFGYLNSFLTKIWQNSFLKLTFVLQFLFHSLSRLLPTKLDGSVQFPLREDQEGWRDHSGHPSEPNTVHFPCSTDNIFHIALPFSCILMPFVFPVQRALCNINKTKEK